MLRKHLPHLILGFLILIVYCIYMFGFTGTVYYDDFRPLSGLIQVSDYHSALYYIFNETSGPLGRPISMLSFLLNINDWDQNLVGFFKINTFIHLINGVLVYIISLRLFQLIYRSKNKNSWLALIVSFWWLVSPLLVSTQLIAVQRMSSISALFVFLGILGYLQGLQVQSLRPRLGVVIQLGSIFIFTLLAMFSKENGVLLPIFTLVLEFTVIARYMSTSSYGSLRLILFSSCLFVIVAYLTSTIPNASVSYSVRNYTLYERIITEPQIVLDYIRLAFIPDIFAYSPFHDNYPKNTYFWGNWSAMGSTLVCLTLLLSALWYRKKCTIYAFAVLWFFAAHLLESTVISIELYFEHRNYIAIFSLYFFVVYGLNQLTQNHSKFTKLIWGGMVIYSVFLAAITFQITSLWGKPEEAAKAWFISQKGSARATEHLALMWLQESKVEPAYQLLKIQSHNCPNCLNSQVQYLMLGCILQHEEETKQQLKRVKTLATQQQFIAGTPSALQALFTQVENKQCSYVSPNDLKNLNMTLIQRTSSISLGRGNHLALNVNLYQIARFQNNKEDEWKYLNAIWSLSYEFGVGKLIIQELLKKEELQKAKDFYDAVCLDIPKKFDNARLKQCQQLKVELKNYKQDK